MVFIKNTKIIILALACLLPPIANATEKVEVGRLFLPVPSSAKIIWQNKDLEVNGIATKASHIRCYSPVSEILAFYKDILLKDGWKIDWSHDDYETLFIFMKEHEDSKKNEYFYLVALKNSNVLPVDVYLVLSPDSLSICKTLSNYFFQDELMEDTEGKDFPDIPRFPGAKRRLNIITPFYGSAIIYEAEATVAEVIDFYRKSLTASGWKDATAGVWGLFQKFRPQLKDKYGFLLLEKENDSLFISAFNAPVQMQPLKRPVKRTLIILGRNIEGEIPLPEEGDVN